MIYYVTKKSYQAPTLIKENTCNFFVSTVYDTELQFQIPKLLICITGIGRECEVPNMGLTASGTKTILLVSVLHGCLFLIGKFYISF